MLERGFTMLEVLITLVILMFGLLGIAGLMAAGQRSSFEAYQLHQALAYANDMAERIKSNQGQAPLYVTGLQPVDGALGAGAAFADIGGGVVDCTAGNCTAAQVAVYDLAVWDGLLSGTSETSTATASANVGGIINAIGCVEQLAGAANNFRVSLAWQGNTATGLPPGSSTCGTGNYGGDDNFRRLVSLDVTVCTLNPGPGFGCATP